MSISYPQTHSRRSLISHIKWKAACSSLPSWQAYNSLPIIKDHENHDTSQSLHINVLRYNKTQGHLWMHNPEGLILVVVKDKYCQLWGLHEWCQESLGLQMSRWFVTCVVNCIERQWHYFFLFFSGPKGSSSASQRWGMKGFETWHCS